MVYIIVSTRIKRQYHAPKQNSCIKTTYDEKIVCSKEWKYQTFLRKIKIPIISTDFKVNSYHSWRLGKGKFFYLKEEMYRRSLNSCITCIDQAKRNFLILKRKWTSRRSLNSRITCIIKWWANRFLFCGKNLFNIRLLRFWKWKVFP